MKKIMFVLIMPFLALAASQPNVKEEPKKQSLHETELYMSVSPFCAFPSLPVPIPLINGGIGVRHMIGHHGLDVALQGNYLINDASVQYLFLMNPNASSTPYLGVGASYVFFCPEISRMAPAMVSPLVTAGWRFKTENRYVHSIQLEGRKSPLGLVTDSNLSVVRLAYHFGISF